MNIITNYKQRLKHLFQLTAFNIYTSRDTKITYPKLVTYHRHILINSLRIVINDQTISLI